MELLRRLGVTSRCGPAAAPLTAIRIIDDRGGLLRAPEVLFRASDVGLAAFGANIANADLTTALEEGVLAEDRVQRIVTPAVTKLEADSEGVTLDLADGRQVRAALVVAADGRNSMARKAADIGTRTWAYPQVAVISTFSHRRPHDGVSTELHRTSGPLTTVPLPGNASSLVWVETPETAARLMALSDRDFLGELEDRLQGLLGALDAPGPRASFPLSGLRADRLGARRTVLVGEAAHVIPPIGAQGLNLGLRDAATIADCIGEAHHAGRDIGGPETLAAYEAARSTDVLMRTAGVDLLNRSLLIDFLPIQALRGVGLHLIANSARIRRAAIETGLGPNAASLPSLMRAARDAEDLPGLGRSA